MSATDFIDLIDRRIDDVLKYPRGWGGVEALEPLVLLLLMLRSSVIDSTSSDSHVVENYREFIAKTVGGGADALHLKLGNLEERMVEILREYVELGRGGGGGE